MSMTDLDTAKQFAMIDHTRQDIALAIVLDAIEEWVSTFAGLKFYEIDDTSYPEIREYVSGGQASLWPAVHPIVNVTGVFDRENSMTEVDSSLYYFNETRIWLQGGGNFGEGSDRWRIHYTAGYTKKNLPAGIKLIILQLFKRAYDKGGGLESESIQGFSQKWQELLTSDELKQLRSFSFERMFS